MPTVAVVDAKGALRAYLNGLTSTLVGAGHPLELGAWIGDGPRSTSRPRGPYRGAYAVLSTVGATTLLGEPIHLPRVSASIYAVTELQADTAAIAYANTLLALLESPPITVNWTPDDQALRSAVLLTVEDVTGPLEVPNPNGEPRRLVDAVIAVTPA